MSRLGLYIPIGSGVEVIGEVGMDCNLTHANRQGLRGKSKKAMASIKSDINFQLSYHKYFTLYINLLELHGRFE